MIAWLTDTLIYTGALIALVLVLRRPAAKHFGPQMSYALWALPLLRFVLPPVVLPASFAPPAETTVTTVTSVTETTSTAALPGEPIVHLPVYEPTFWEMWGNTVLGATLALWLAGALAFIGWRACTYIQMREWLLDGARPVGESGRVRLVETPAVSAPVAFGVSDKVVALPIGFMAHPNRAARDLAIEHELAHHRGRDLLANMLAQPILALHWFNPLAWMGWRAMRRDQEAACDARVIARRAPQDRAVYGQVIASFASGQRLALAAPMACPVLGEKSIIHRLRSLSMGEISPRRRLLGRALLTSAMVAVPATASVSYAETASKTETSTTHGSHITIIDVPEGAAPDDRTLHTRVIEKDGQTIVLKTAQPVSDEEARARIERAQASMASADALVNARSALEDRGEFERQRAELSRAHWEKQAAEWEKNGAAWDKWGDEFSKQWEKFGAQMSRGEAATVTPPAAPAAPVPPAAIARVTPFGTVAPTVSVAVAAPFYGVRCDRNGNAVPIRGARSAGDASAQAENCKAIANANARRALQQARSSIERNHSLDEGTRDTILDSLDDQIDRLSDQG